jgi:hypothetical protein
MIENSPRVIDAWCFPRESHNGFDSVMRFQFHGMIQIVNWWIILWFDNKMIACSKNVSRNLRTVPSGGLICISNKKSISNFVVCFSVEAQGTPKHPKHYPLTNGSSTHMWRFLPRLRDQLLFRFSPDLLFIVTVRDQDGSKSAAFVSVPAPTSW